MGKEFLKKIRFSSELEYNDSVDVSRITNVLLIDKDVKGYKKIVDSVNENTFYIVYSVTSKKTDLLDLLVSKFTSIQRLALCFESSLGMQKMFLDYGYLFTPADSVSPYGGNVVFLIDLIRRFSIGSIDFLACKTLLYPNWVDFYALLNKETGVIVGASSDATGNLKYGGDWVLENTSLNVEYVYFNRSIEYYQYVLDNPEWVTGLTDTIPLLGPTAMAVYGDYLYVASKLEDGSYNNISKISLPDGTVTEPFWSDISNVSNANFVFITGMTIDNVGEYMYVVDSPFLDFFYQFSTVYKINLSNGQIDSSNNTLSYYMFDIKWHENYLYTSSTMYNSSGSFIVQLDTSLNEITTSYPASNEDALLLCLLIYNNNLYVTDVISGNIFQLDLDFFNDPEFVITNTWNNSSPSLYFGMCLSEKNLFVCDFGGGGGYGGISLFDIDTGNLINPDISNAYGYLSLPFNIVQYQDYFYISNFNFGPGYISQISYTPPEPPVSPVTNPPNTNGVMYVPYGMPFKEETANGDSNFSLGRQIYYQTTRANASFTPQIMQQKKWIGGCRDASQRITDARTNAVGLGSINFNGGPISFKNVVDHNTERNARQRARSGGAVAPLKKGKSHNFF